MERKKYRRISCDERIEIEKLISQKKSYTEIANHLRRNKSSIQREVSRYGRDKYKAMKASRDAVFKSSDKRLYKTKINGNIVLEKYVMNKLELRWSPQ